MNHFGERLNRLAGHATDGHQLSQPPSASNCRDEDRRPRRVLTLGLALLVLIAGMSVWFFQDATEPTSVVAAHGSDQAVESETAMPSGWNETVLSDEPDTPSLVAPLTTETASYAALVNQAQNVLNTDCMSEAGYAFPRGDISGNRQRQPDFFDLQREPFAADGGYARLTSRFSGPSLTPEANAEVSAHNEYVQALPVADLARYESALADCRTTSREHVLGDLAAADDFYELVNIGTNLQGRIGAWASTHPGVQATIADWSRCMQDAGQEISTRSQALELSMEERRLPTGLAAQPGPIELSLVASDRQCSQSTNYFPVQWSSLIAAERFMAAHDAELIRFAREWPEAATRLRPRLDEVLGLDITSSLIPIEATEESDDDGGAIDEPPYVDRLSFLPNELRPDLDLMHAAIDYRLELDVAQCLRRRGWQAPDPILQKSGPADRVHRSTVTALQAALDHPRSDALAGFRAGLSSDDRVLFESHRTDCLSRSDWNVGDPLTRVLGNSASEHASDAVAADPVFLAAQAERSACNSKITDQQKQEAAALESEAQELFRDFETGLATAAEVRGLLPNLLARSEAMPNPVERCEQAYSAVVAPLYDGYFAQFMLADPDLEQRIAELQREVDVYREILDELKKLD